MESLNIEIVVKFRISNAIDAETLNEQFRARPIDFVRWSIENEGLVGIVDDFNGELISAKVVD